LNTLWLSGFPSNERLKDLVRAEVGEGTVPQKLFLTYINMKFFPSFGVENNFVQACWIHPVFCTSYCKLHHHSRISYAPHFVPGHTANKSLEQGPFCIVINPSDSKKKILFFVETKGLLPCLQERAPLLYLGPDKSLPPCFFKVHFNIILPHTPRISKSCVVFRFSDQHIACTSHAIILCRSLLGLCLPRP
jgi:hypothetical protein